MTEQLNPLVSVLIATHNRLPVLMRAIESVMKQLYHPLELLIVDDASSDGTAQQVRERWPEIHLICLHKNSGVCMARNIGIANARGEYIYLLDDDGWLEPRAIEHSVAVLQAHPEIGAVESRLNNIVDNSEVGAYKEYEDVVYIQHFVECCSLLRREAVIAAGYFSDTLFWGAEGEELSLRMLYNGYRCCYQPASVMFHELRNKSRENHWIARHTLRNSTRIALWLWPFPWNIFRIGKNLLWNTPKQALRSRYLWLPLLMWVGLINDLTVLAQHRCCNIDQKLFNWYRRLPAQNSVHEAGKSNSI